MGFVPMRHAWLATLLVACLVTTPAAMQAEDSQNLAVEGALGAGSALISMVYGPAKLVYAATGAVLSGLTWMWTWGNGDVSGSVYRQTLAGDYVITPEHLTGSTELTFAAPGRR